MKNIITNIIGITLIFVGVYGLMCLDLELMKFGAIQLMGGVAVYFNNETIKKYLKKAINKYLK